MFTKSKNRRKIGAITLLDAAILPVNPATLKASIEANGLILDGLDSQLDMHQFELTAADKDAVITGGSVAVFGKGNSGNGQWQPLQKDDADYVLDLSKGITVIEVPNGSMRSIAVVPTVAITVSAGTEFVLENISGRKG